MSKMKKTVLTNEKQRESVTNGMNDPNIEAIKTAVKAIVPECEIILFGSRAKKDFDEKSDYDIMIILPFEPDIREKMRLGTRIRKVLAQLDIPADIIIHGNREAEIKKEFPGNIVREAFREGVVI